MKTEQEIMQMVSTCNNYYGCGACPYNPEDLSMYIGDKWKGGCPNYDRKLVYAMGKGYGDVSEYKAEIERLKAEASNIRKDTAKEILYMLYDMGIDNEILECCRICDVNGVSLAKQICEKYGVEIEK
jgi:hypothetical protein